MTGLMKMTKNEKREIISKYLDELFPNPKCELNYNKDYELLIATMLSAQTTDKKVNEATKILFKKYHDDYNFIIEKDNILKKIFYLYISHLDFKDKIIICKNYKLWEYEWDSLKEEYQTTNC